jgi:hypothetical protein
MPQLTYPSAGGTREELPGPGRGMVQDLYVTRSRGRLLGDILGVVVSSGFLGAF